MTLYGNTPAKPQKTGTRAFFVAMLINAKNASCLVLTLLVAAPAFAWDTNQTADVVVGQTDMISISGGTTGYTVDGATHAVVIDGKLLVSDQVDHRVLIYNTFPTENNATADVVIGQTDLLDYRLPSSITAASLRDPFSLTTDGTKLIVLQAYNRALLYNSVPTQNNASADVVIGQTNFTSSTIGTSAYQMNSADGIACDGTRIYVADTANDRVLIYNTIPVANNTSADVVVGQTDMVSIATGTTAYLFSAPYKVASDGTKLAVMDGKSRVLIYNTIPVANNASADVVVGQTDLISDATGTSAYSFKTLNGMSMADGKLYTMSYDNNRMLVYNTIPVANNASADVVVGQTDFTSGNGGTSAFQMNYPKYVYSDGTRLLAIDTYSNNRILVYNSIPTENNVSADVVIGQTDFVSEDKYVVSANKLNQPTSAVYDGTKLYIRDTYSNRVLIYNSLPATANVSADVVVGQTDMVSSNGTTTAYGLYFSQKNYIFADGTRLITNSYSNNRVLIYNSIPTQNNTSADVVVGQTDFTSASAGTTAYNIRYSSGGVYYDNTRLFVPDTNSHRVLIYNALPTENNASADVVVGQTDMISDSSGTTAYELKSPKDVFSDGTKLFINDRNNFRVLIYNTIPVANNASADAVVGQTDMVSEENSLNAYNLRSAGGISIDNGSLYIPNALYRSRVLVYDSIPVANNASADAVIGQTDFTSNDSQSNAYGFDEPSDISVSNYKMVVTDELNNRIMIYNDPDAPVGGSAQIIIS